MKVFISWSGDQSRRVAERLRDWLPCVIQTLEPWMSSEDIRKGTRWPSEIASALETARAGILCITRENLEAPWLIFEAGALSKAIPNSGIFVCTYLYRVEPSDLARGPLAQFQHTKAEKSDTLKLLETLNGASGQSGLKSALLQRLFEKWWPDFESALAKLPSSAAPSTPIRSDRELLEDIWEFVRDQARTDARFDEEDLEEEELPRLDIMEALKRSLQQTSRVRNTTKKRESLRTTSRGKPSKR